MGAGHAPDPLVRRGRAHLRLEGRGSAGQADGGLPLDLPARTRPQVAEVTAELQTGANPRRFSANRNYRKDGSVVHCEWYNSSLLDESGKLRSILSLVLDVTERKRAEEALKESEAKYRNLFESMTEEVHFWKLDRDEDGRIITWRLIDANPPTLKTWGKTTLARFRGRRRMTSSAPAPPSIICPVIDKSDA